MEKIHCVIIDDDPNAVLLIEQYLLDYKQFKNIGSFLNPIKALEELPKLSPKLIFLDVNMPKLSGIELINKLGTDYDIILTTGSAEYVIESYEYNVIDYLLKPISSERFAKSINKFNEKKGYKLCRSNIELAERINKTNTLFVKQNYKTFQIPLTSILYLESEREYVKIVTQTNIFKTKQSLSFFGKRLKFYSFIRVHRSFIVSSGRVNSYTSTEIKVNNKKIPIGRSYQKELATNIQSI